MNTNDNISLSKFLAMSGIGARRKTTELVKSGQVMVNNEVITEPGFKLKPQDKVYYDNRLIKSENKIYILLNKPKQYITSTEDEKGRRTVLDLITIKDKKRMYPIGRLDRDTTGLLLLTNDGELAQKLAHPKHGTPKSYRVTLDKPLETLDCDKLHFGIKLIDGLIKPDRLYIVPGSRKYQVVIEIHSGKNRIIRRIFEKLGYHVVALDRFKYAGLTKKGLFLGRWRSLTVKEVALLKKI